jgi:hypothetical protein
MDGLDSLGKFENNRDPAHLGAAAMHAVGALMAIDGAIAAVKTHVSGLEPLTAASSPASLTAASSPAAVTAADVKSLAELLFDEIGWATSGLAGALGLPAVPGLEIVDGVLVYKLTALASTLEPAPATFGYEEARLAARLRLDGAAPILSIALELDGLEAGVGGGAVSSLLGGAEGSVQADAVLGVDTVHGLTLSGGASQRVVLPARTKVGPLDFRELGITLPAASNRIDIDGTIATDIGGVIGATVVGAGIHVAITGSSTAPIEVTVKPPSGIGLNLDTGLVRGGGFVSEREGGYGGALQLRLGPAEVKAVGLLTLEPSFALVVVMSVEFLSPIDLSFGFTLSAVGGVVGIEHRLDGEALRDSFASGALDHILFPADPVAAAPAILGTLEQVFPVDQGSIVIGPMVKIGWGRPVSFLTAEAGLVLSLPDPKIVLVGKVRITLPSPDVPTVDLRAAIYGEITPDHLLILVSLTGSRIAGFSIGGDIGVLLRWRGAAEFAISAGGFHPRYDPPKELAGMNRLSVDLSPPAILTLRAEAYFATTTNSVQLGARVEMSADLDPVEASGYFAFDALIVFSPHFMFMLDIAIGISVRVFGVTLLGVHVELHVEGPSPWRARGYAEVEVLFWTVEVELGPYVWGDEATPPPLPAHPRELVHGALHRNPGAWQALAPPDADRVVTLKGAEPSDTDVTVHPMGLFDVRQHAVPLETVMVRVSANPVPEGERRVHLGVPLVSDTPAGALSEVTDLFSAGNYLDLSDDEKLSRPSFEPMPAGVRIRPPGERAAFAASRHAELRYETFVCDDDALIGVSIVDTKATATKTAAMSVSEAIMLAAGAAGRSALRATQRYARKPDPIVLAGAGEVVPVSKITISAATAAAHTYWLAAESPLAEDIQLARLGVA